uniref:Ig-like domain-containing protein n=1 Tax=Ditylenchus dipsaci TaxID=166011 RepID=A0A915ERI1_9BILA
MSDKKQKSSSCMMMKGKWSTAKGIATTTRQQTGINQIGTQELNGIGSKESFRKGDAPYIVVSAGGRGIKGTTDIQLLPGSAYNVFCRATGKPQPSVKWIRGGNIAIDPSTVKSDESATRWSLNVANITEDTNFNCVAQNSLGVANWTI